MSPRMKTVLASYPDKEELIAEVYFDDELWAAVSCENGPATLELYPPPDGSSWRFDFADALEALQQAYRRLSIHEPPSKETASISSAAHPAR